MPCSCVLVLLAAIPAAAQTSTDFTAAIHHLHTGQLVFLVYGDGEFAEGTLDRVTADALTLSTKGAERKEIPAGTIHRIDRRDSVWNGMIIGGALLGTVGMSAAGASCSPNCGSAVAGGAAYFGAIGAGVGALVDASIHGRTPVYVATAKPAAIDRPVPPVSRPSEPASTTALSSPVQQLWTRVAPGTTIEVVDRTGASTRGKFVTSSATSVVVRANGVETMIPSSRVRRVSRVGHHAAKGALIGGLVGATGDLVNAATQDGGGGIAGTFSGTLWGAVIGRFIPKRTVVYDAPVATATGTPSVSRDVADGFDGEGLIVHR